MTPEANGESQRGGEEAFDPAEHRAFVRELNRSLALTYGVGGGLVLVAAAAALVGAWVAGWFWSPVTWLAVITGVLIGLLVLRMVVYRRVRRLFERLEAYCRANDVEPARLRAHYDDEHLYPYFQALFELKQRRERIHHQEASGREGPVSDEDEQ